LVSDAAVTVDPEDTHALKDRLAVLASDADLRVRLSRAGLRRARHFNWELTAAQTLEVYAAALTADPAPARAPVGWEAIQP
jgi:glycosyltransferase involved in cell wall biosynthesis